jgi:hypothetical protein
MKGSLTQYLELLTEDRTISRWLTQLTGGGGGGSEDTVWNDISATLKFNAYSPR